jgi:hypothetical protein
MPQRVEIFIEPDGGVVIADLLDGLLPVAHALDADAAPACPVRPRVSDSDSENVRPTGTDIDVRARDPLPDPRPDSDSRPGVPARPGPRGG